MPEPTYYSLITEIGAAKLANAMILGQAIALTHLAVGDGLGAAYNPTRAAEALRREVWRDALADVRRDADNAAHVICEAIVPAAAGPFWVREAGIFDTDGDLIAIIKYPETYKPSLDSGAGKDLLIRVVLEISGEASVVVRLDPTVVLATRAHVEDQLRPLRDAVALRPDGSVAAHPNTLFSLAAIVANGGLGGLPDPGAFENEGRAKIRMSLSHGGPATITLGDLP